MSLRYTNPIGLIGWMYNAHVGKSTTHSPMQVKLFETLVAPWALPLDRLIRSAGGPVARCRRPPRSLMPATVEAAPSTTLARRLGFWSAIGVVVGLAIGSGIFRTPASIAARVPDPAAMLGVWLAGGVISLCGALSVAELSAALPHTGGWYVYLREAWGRLPAFLFGWAQLILLRGTVIGGIAAVFGEYFLRSIGVDSWRIHWRRDWSASPPSWWPLRSTSAAWRSAPPWWARPPWPRSAGWR